MKTEILEKCVEILSYWEDYADPKMRNYILSSETNFRKGYVEPFSKELVENLIENENIDAPEKLIIHYITKLTRAVRIDFDYVDIDHTEWGDKKYDFPEYYKSLNDEYEKAND
jgi:hypothetical protein